MSRTVIDLDDELVADVAKALGTRSKKETVNSALREVLEIRRRALALARPHLSVDEPSAARKTWPIRSLDDLTADTFESDEELEEFATGRH